MSNDLSNVPDCTVHLLCILKCWSLISPQKLHQPWFPCHTPLKTQVFWWLFYMKQYGGCQKQLKYRHKLDGVLSLANKPVYQQNTQILLIFYYPFLIIRQTLSWQKPLRFTQNYVVWTSLYMSCLIGRKAKEILSRPEKSEIVNQER